MGMEAVKVWMQFRQVSLGINRFSYWYHIACKVLIMCVYELEGAKRVTVTNAMRVLLVEKMVSKKLESGEALERGVFRFTCTVPTFSHSLS